MSKSKIYMIPCPIAENAEHTIPQYVIQQIHEIRFFIVERAKTARHFLKSIKHPLPLQEIHVEQIVKHDKLYAETIFQEWTNQNKTIGIISEAGCPGIADPGALFAGLAHRKGLEIKPLVGPSSIFLALMASGMNGQTFTFHGYLPNKKPELSKELNTIVKKISKHHSSEIFIETPYRNEALFTSLIRECPSNLSLCIAADITGSKEYIKTQSISMWKKSKFPFKEKIPAIFILG